MIPTSLYDFIHSLATLDPFWIYAIIFLIAFTENLFPPTPSDVIVVCGGALAAMGQGYFVVALIAGTVGSTLGFIMMYGIGRLFGRKVLDTGRLKFIKRQSIEKIEQWFGKYGYWLIIANRFLSGTRAVVSFFAGISRLDLRTTAVLSFISSLLWYGILVYAGYSLGYNWEKIGDYLHSYSAAMTGILIVFVLALLIRFVYRKMVVTRTND